MLLIYLNVFICLMYVKNVKLFDLIIGYKDENSLGLVFGGVVGGVLFLVLFVSVGVVIFYKCK